MSRIHERKSAAGPSSALRTIVSALRWARVPLAFYYLVTVLVPLANGSGDTSHAFVEHMAFVLFAPPTLIVPFALAGHAWRKAALTIDARIDARRHGDANCALVSNQRSA